MKIVMKRVKEENDRNKDALNKNLNADKNAEPGINPLVWQIPLLIFGFLVTSFIIIFTIIAVTS